ncbi:streptophobe family protein, partial [Streptomyces sp. NPDC096080]
MSPTTSPDRVAVRHGWLPALVAVVASMVTMLLVAALGLWAAGAAGLPGGGFVRVVAATVVTAVGGRVALSGNAGSVAGTEAGVTA